MNFLKMKKMKISKKNFMGTCSIDSITRYVNFYEIIKRRNGKYPFAIYNTGKEN